MDVGELYNPKRLFTGIFIPESMVRLPNSTLCPGSKLLFGRLSWHVSDDGECFPSRDTLADEIGVSVSSVKDYLRELEDQGFIIRVRTGPRANSYDFPWHPVLEASLKKKRRTPECPSSTAPPQGVTDTRLSNDGHPSVFPSSYIREDLREVEPSVVSHTPITEKSLKWVSQRFRNAGKKLAASEQREMMEWLGEVPNCEEDVEASLAKFFLDDYWRQKGFPPSAYRGQFEKYLDLAREESPAAEDPAQAKGPVGPKTPDTAPPSPAARQDAPVAQIDYVARWNELVPAKPCAGWSPSREPGLALALSGFAKDVEFSSRFDEICGLARDAIANNELAPRFMDFRWLLRKDKETGAWNWWRLLTTMRDMAQKSVSRAGYGHDPKKASADADSAMVKLRERFRKQREEEDEED
jgi:DNA-binding Lrp family transcriptional regulator